MAKVRKASKASATKKKSAKKLVKPAVKKKTAIKKAVVKKKKSIPVKKAAKKVQLKKTAAKPASKKVKAAPKKAKAPVKKAKPIAKNNKPVKAEVRKAIAPPAVKAKGRQPLPPPAKVKPSAEEKLHSKAQRIMKELEETMDMTKVKPRIKVPVYTPPKPKPVPVIRLPEPTNTKKIKYQLEFEFRSSKGILFSYLSDSSGMAGWFADEVRSSDDNYVFVWEGSEVHAKQVAVKDLQLVRYQWTDEADGTYFQFEIKEDDITSDIALLITDWAFEDEKDTNRMLWENQVQKLRQLLGSL